MATRRRELDNELTGDVLDETTIRVADVEETLTQVKLCWGYV
jgi:hypothetical protein